MKMAIVIINKEERGKKATKIKSFYTQSMILWRINENYIIIINA